MNQMQKSKEIAFCGIDCEKCVKFKDVFAEKAKEIIKSIKESGLDEWQKHEPREKKFSYEDFKKGLAWFEKHMRCPGCNSGGGNPDCLIKNCCKKKDVKNCSKCSDFPCDKIKKFKEENNIDVEKNIKANLCPTKIT